MIKYFLKILLFILFPCVLHAQQNVDSLRYLLSTASDDSSRYLVYRSIYDYYEESNRDSAFYYADLSLELTRKNKKKLAEVHALNNKAYQLIGMGRYAESLQNLFEAFKIAEDPALDKEKTWRLFSVGFSGNFSGNDRLLMLSYTHHMMGVLMWQTDNNEQTIFHFKEARRISSEISHYTRQMMADMNLGRSYMTINQLDTALVLENEAVELSFKTGFKKYLGQVYSVIAGIYQKKNDDIRTKQYYYMAVQISKEQNNLNNLNTNYFLLTKYYLAEGNKDSALYYARKNMEVIQQLGPVAGLTVNIGTVYENIYLGYKLGRQQDSIFKYQGLTLTVKDSLYKIRIKNLTDFQNLTLKEQLRLQNVEKEKELYQGQIRSRFLLAGIAVLLLLAIIFYRNNRQKHKAKLKVEQAYDNLKATQQQLIQSEKMASLGELTAGIAHEIQNPLNFVNNFSEVSAELTRELVEEVNKGDKAEASAIANDLIQNLEKINHHGKRAGAIVKGMLQHSRSGSGQKELTDINLLADEYLRLSYHGLRAKDKSFNAKFETDLDPAVGKINIMPQDLGRVILNLINNAFYAVSANKKAKGNTYEPTVTLTTKKINGKIEISVKDNGTGIPQKILDKIFQPFFTTKPTGLGTGLGLSLSYDIVKVHGGEIRVNTKENEGTEFIIQLPA